MGNLVKACFLYESRTVAQFLVSNESFEVPQTYLTSLFTVYTVYVETCMINDRERRVRRFYIRGGGVCFSTLTCFASGRNIHFAYYFTRFIKLLAAHNRPTGNVI